MTTRLAPDEPCPTCDGRQPSCPEAGWGGVHGISDEEAIREGIRSWDAGGYGPAIRSIAEQALAALVREGDEALRERDAWKAQGVRWKTHVDKAEAQRNEALGFRDDYHEAMKAALAQRDEAVSLLREWREWWYDDSLDGGSQTKAFTSMLDRTRALSTEQEEG